MHAAQVLPLVALAGSLVVSACERGPSADVTVADPPATEAQDAPVQPAANVDPDLPVVTVYKSPTCGCCRAWVEHLQEDGFRVEVVDMNDRSALSSGRGVPRELGSCHTAVVGDYVVEGHVPAADIRRLLEEAPDAAGLAVPGMPIGSPGMEQGDHVQPYDVMLIARDGGQHSVFSSHGG
jgi:hypothetical protein